MRSPKGRKTTGDCVFSQVLYVIYTKWSCPEIAKRADGNCGCELPETNKSPDYAEFELDCIKSLTSARIMKRQFPFSSNHFQIH